MNDSLLIGSTALEASERAILATMIESTNGDLPPTISKLLDNAPEAFIDVRHGAIAVAIRRLRCEGRAVRPDLLLPVLSSDKNGSALLLGSEALASPLPVDLAEIEAESVWQAYVERQTEATLNDGLSALRSQPSSAKVIVKGVIKSLARVATNRSNGPETPRNRVDGTKPDSEAELVAMYGPPISFKTEGGAIASINERFFAARFAQNENILFEPDERRFYRYNSQTGIWRAESDESIREAISASVCDYGRNADLPIEGKISVARMNGILSALRGIAERRAAFHQRRDFVHVGNGVVRFPEDGPVILSGFQPGDYSRNRSPIEFQKDGDCPTFVNELLHVALSHDDRDLLQRWAGLAIAGVNPAQRIFILDGGPATGKSTFARIMQLLVGAENTAQLRTALLFERFELFRFIDKTLLLAPDVPGDFLNRPSAAALKSLVGGDPLTAEAKGSNAVFTLAGKFNVLITANARLRVRLDGDAGAWRRRITIIRFENPPAARRVPNFADTLVAKEGPGILRWAMAGLLKAREEIASTGDLALTPTQEGRVDDLLSESDSVRRFIRECTMRSPGNVTSHELVEAYFRFCSSNEWTPQPARIVERTLADAILETHGASRAQDIARNGRSVRGWRNITLTETHE